MTQFADAWVIPAIAGLIDWSIRWGGLVVLVAAWWAIRPPGRASVRYWLLTAVLIAGVALPFLPRWGAGFVGTRGLVETPKASPVAPAAVAPMPQPGPALPIAAGPAEPRPITIEGASPAPTRVGAPRPVGPKPEPLGPLRIAALVAAALWFLSAGALLARLVVGWWALRRLRRSAVPVGEAEARLFEACRRELGLRRRAGLAVHAEVGSPVAIGGLRPLVLVPTDWDRLPESVRRAGLLHELAHLKHLDDWARLAQEIFRSVAAFHPATHWTLDRLDRERERVCDEAAVARGVDPRDFARMLLDFARRPQPAVRSAVALPFLRPGTVKDRIERLLEDGYMRRISPLSAGRTLAFGLATLVAALGLGSVRVGADDRPGAGRPVVDPGLLSPRLAFPPIAGADAMVPISDASGAVDPPFPEEKAVEPRVLSIKQENQVLALAFSPDGSLLATIGNKWKYQAQGQEGVLSLWEPKSGQLVRTITVPEMGLGKVAFAPDRKTVAATVGGAEVRLWDASTGALKQTLRVTEGLPERLEALAFSPDGKTLAAGGSHGPLLIGQGGYIQLWDLITGDPIGVLDRGTVSVASVAFSPDGQTLASGGGPGISPDEVALWDWHASKEQLEDKFGLGRVGRVNASMGFNGRDAKAGSSSNAHVLAVAYAPDGKTVAAGGFIYNGLDGAGASAELKDVSGQVSLYEAETGKLVGSFTTGKPVSSVAFSPDGRSLLAVTSDDRAAVWDLGRRAVAQSLPGKHHFGQGAFSPDGRSVAIGDADGKIELISLLAGLDEPRKVRDPTEPKREDEGVHIQGHVVDAETGKPVSRFIVQDGRVDPKDPRRIEWGLAEGRITSPNPEGLLGDAVLRWDRGDRIRVLAEGYLPQPVLDGPPPAGTREMDVTVRLRRGREVSGRVVDADDKPVAGAGVFLVGNRNVNLTGGQAIQAFVGGVDRTVTRAETDADGRFTLAGGGGDANVVAVSAPGLDLWAVAAPKPGDDATIRLPRAGRLSIRYDIEGAPSEGTFFLQMLTESPARKPWPTVENHREVRIPDGGKLELADLAPGAYDLARRKETRVGSMGRTTFCDRRRIEVRSGALTLVDNTRPAGGTVFGRIANLGDLKLDGAFVYVRSPDATGRPGDFDDIQKPYYDAVAALGPEGRFRTERLAPGDYAIVVHAYKPPPPDEDAFNRRRLGGGLQPPDYTAAVSVVVKADSQTEVAPITLKPYTP